MFCMNLRLYILSFCVLIGIENVFCLRGGSFTLSSSGLSIHAKSFKPFSRLQAYQQTGKHVRLPNAHPSISKSELVSVVNSVLAADVQTHFQTTASVMPHASALQGKPERKLDSKQWNELLEASLYYKQNIMVLKLMGRMRELHVALAPEVGLRLITHLAEEGDFEESRNTLQYMHNCGNAHSVHPYLALLRCSGSFTRAQSVLFLMERARLRVNVMTYSVAIKSCERTGDIASALHLLQQMRVVGIPPNDVTYCCAISVASKARRPDIAVSLLREMGTTANALSNRSTVDDSDIRDSSNEEDASGLLIGSSSSGGSASGSSSSGGSGVVNQLCYGGALTACARSGHWREVDTLLGEIVTSGAQIQETIFVAVLLALKSQDLSAKRFAGAVVPSTSTQSRSADFMASGEVVWHLDSLLRQWAPHLNCTSDRIFSLAMEMYEQHQQSALVLEAYALRERHVPAQVPVGKTLVECVMRASLNLSDADTAVQVVAQARRWGVLSTSVFLSALAVLETTQQHGRAVHLLVEAVAPPDHARMNVEGGGGDSEVDSAVGMSALQIPRPTIRQVLHNALGAITQDFMAAQQQPDSCGNESDAAATAPIALSRIQRKDVLVLLRSVLEAGEMLDPQCYPMACKLLHGDHTLLRVLLNQTLHALPQVDSDKLYTYAARSVLFPLPVPPATNNQQGPVAGNVRIALDSVRTALSATLLLVDDLCAAARLATAQAVFMLGVDRLKEIICYSVQSEHCFVEASCAHGKDSEARVSSRHLLVQEPAYRVIVAALSNCGIGASVVGTSKNMNGDGINGRFSGGVPEEVRAGTLLFQKYVASGKRVLGKDVNLLIKVLHAEAHVYGTAMQPELLLHAHQQLLNTTRAALLANGTPTTSQLAETVAVMQALSGFPDYHEHILDLYRQAIMGSGKSSSSGGVPRSVVDAGPRSRLAENYFTDKFDQGKESSLECTMHATALKVSASVQNRDKTSHSCISTDSILRELELNGCTLAPEEAQAVVIAAALKPEGGEAARQLLSRVGRLVTGGASGLDFLLAQEVVLAFCRERRWKQAWEVYIQHSHQALAGSSTAATTQVLSKRKLTCDTLVDAVATHGDLALAETIYVHALAGGVFNALHSVHRGLVDLQYHSPLTAQIAVRVVLQMLSFLRTGRLFSLDEQFNNSKDAAGTLSSVWGHKLRQCVDALMANSDQNNRKDIVEGEKVVKKASNAQRGEVVKELVIVLDNPARATLMTEYLLSGRAFIGHPLILGTVVKQPSSRIVVPADPLVEWMVRFHDSYECF